MDLLPRLVSPARQPSSEPFVLVLLHGLGSDEADLFSLAPELDPRLTVVALRAPYSYSMGGYAWFDVRWTSSSVEFDGAQAVVSRDLLIGNIQAIGEEFGVAPERLFVGGFSQGAMMTLGVMLHQPDLLGGAMLFSGSVVTQLAADPPKLTLPVFQSHGVYDPVLPIGLGRIVRDLVTGCGAPLEYHEYPMEHEISYPCLRDAEIWLSKLLADRETHLGG